MFPDSAVNLQNGIIIKMLNSFIWLTTNEIIKTTINYEDISFDRATTTLEKNLFLLQRTVDLFEPKKIFRVLLYCSSLARNRKSKFLFFDCITFYLLYNTETLLTIFWTVPQELKLRKADQLLLFDRFLFILPPERVSTSFIKHLIRAYFNDTTLKS